jgi:hypothetical protein
MRFRSKIFFLGLILWLGLAFTACQAGSLQPYLLPEESLTLQPGQAVRVEVNSGNVVVRGTETENLVISGRIADEGKTQYSLSSLPDEVLIAAKTRQAFFSVSEEAPIELEIEAPQGISITVATFEGLVAVEDLQGSIKVDSTAGTVVGRNLQGSLSLRSGRGDVTCSGCSGEVRVVGEHGLLTIEDSHGQIGSTTIMGAIHYTGLLLAGDALHFEVDHGPVRVDVQPESDAEVSIQSTSGVVVCPPRFGGTSRICTGTFGSGAGSLDVRTVSGDVTLRELP